MTKISQDVQEVFSKKLYERVIDLMFGEGVSKAKGREIANAVRNAFDEACQEQDVLEV